jgi:hypothetical protein
MQTMGDDTDNNNSDNSATKNNATDNDADIDADDSAAMHTMDKNMEEEVVA